MGKLMGTVHEEYSALLVYPDKSLIFKPFISTPWEELKVVILGIAPYTNGIANGLAYANLNADPNDIKPVSKSMRRIEECVDGLDDEHKWCKFWFHNYDLEHWAEQGVLLLNTSLTTPKRKARSHTKLWRPFTAKVIDKIVQEKSGIIFCMWGDSAKAYITDEMLTKHHVLQYMHPTAAGENQWACPTFEGVNEILQLHNNKPIRW